MVYLVSCCFLDFPIRGNKELHLEIDFDNILYVDCSLCHISLLLYLKGLRVSLVIVFLLEPILDIV